MAAAVSPLGDKVAVHLGPPPLHRHLHRLDARTGKVLKRVVRGDASASFENVPSFRSSLSWSADGKRLAFVAQSKARDMVYVVDAEGENKILSRSARTSTPRPTRRSRRTTTASSSPPSRTAAPTSISTTSTGSLTRLTDDTWDEKETSWSPDGKKLMLLLGPGATR
jgi:Tol biopolymer transport system component